VSDRSQFLFVYEKGVVNNEKRVRVAPGTYTLREAILHITGEKDLQMRVIDNYILLFKTHSDFSPFPVSDSSLLPVSDLSSSTIIEGYVKDRRTREALSFSYILLESAGVGTVSNMDGRFSLKVPDSLSTSYVTISHIGYHSPIIPLKVFEGSKPEIFMEPNTIQLQEVVVRYVPAQKIVREMIENMPKNYAPDPAYFTSFYREGVEYGGGFVSLTEGVCQIYKSSLGEIVEDNVKLLKMRNITNRHYPDSILVKLQAGVRASLDLDIVKYTPDFLATDRDQYFDYVLVGMEAVDSGMVHVISFKQRDHVMEPFYTGLLYIDSENRALVRAEFEVNPRYIKQMRKNIIVRKSKDLVIDMQKISYSVSYRRWNGYYWMNHVRGDIQFKIKKKKSLFGGAERWNAYFEIATCEIDSKDVKPFPNRERLQTSKVFSQTQFMYDADFWERFNTILPEVKTTEAILKLLLQVEVQE